MSGFFSAVTIPAILQMANQRLERYSMKRPLNYFPFQRKLFCSLFFFRNSSLLKSSQHNHNNKSSTIEKPRIQRRNGNRNWQDDEESSQESTIATATAMDISIHDHHDVPNVVKTSNNKKHRSSRMLRSHPTQSKLVQRFASSASRFFSRTKSQLHQGDSLY